MVSFTITQSKLLLLLATPYLIEQCHSFVVVTRKLAQCESSTSSYRRNFVLSNTLTQLSTKDGEEDDAKASEEENVTRRQFITSFSCAMLTSATLASNSLPGAAIESETEQMAEQMAEQTTAVKKDDDDKIVLTVSADNYPKHSYEISAISDDIDSSLTSSTSSGMSIAEETPPVRMCTDDLEARRIAVFERAAPSVVFLDTFVEQRDTFTANV
eukprot:10604109-Ditylum_brightwellii.AAC.1